MKISIIIPVHNSETYILKCIESIITQSISLNEYEIVLINDGSTDRTSEIIQDIIKNNSNVNISYYEQRNQGVSVARNNGVKICNGQYVLFVDSDDMLADDFLVNVCSYIDGNDDVIKFKIQSIEQKEYDNRFDLPFFSNLNGNEAIEKFCNSNKIFATPWGYIIRRDFIIKNNLFFEKNRFHEDYGYIPIVIHKAASISSINLLGYKYIKRNNSMVTDTSTDIEIVRIKDFIFHTISLISYFLNNENDIQRRNNIINYFYNRLEIKINNLDDKVVEGINKSSLILLETIKNVIYNKNTNHIDINKLSFVYMKNIYKTLFSAIQYFESNLVNLTLGGSAGKLDVIEEWSDLDIYIVLNEYDTEKVRNFIEEINRCNFHIGITFYTMDEVKNNCIDGKTKIMLYEQQKYGFNPNLYGENVYNLVNYEDIVENDLMNFPNVLHEFRRLHIDAMLDPNCMNKKYVKKLLVLIKCYLNLHNIFTYGYKRCLREFINFNNNSEFLTGIINFDIIENVNDFEKNKYQFLQVGEKILKCLNIEMEDYYGKKNKFKRYNN